MRMARASDGEAFAILPSNPALSSPVRLDIRPIEAEQVATARLSPRAIRGDQADGGAFGNPELYYVRKEHPGGNSGSPARKYDCIPAQDMSLLQNVWPTCPPRQPPSRSGSRPGAAPCE